MSSRELETSASRTSGLVQDGGQSVKSRFCIKSKVIIEQNMTKIKNNCMFSFTLVDWAFVVIFILSPQRDKILKFIEISSSPDPTRKGS